MTHPMVRYFVFSHENFKVFHDSLIAFFCSTSMFATFLWQQNRTLWASWKFWNSLKIHTTSDKIPFLIPLPFSTLEKSTKSVENCFKAQTNIQFHIILLIKSLASRKMHFFTSSLKVWNFRIIPTKRIPI